MFGSLFAAVAAVAALVAIRFRDVPPLGATADAPAATEAEGLPAVCAAS